MSDRSFLDKFAINSAGEVVLRRPLDYETADSYNYQVMVTDGISVSVLGHFSKSLQFNHFCLVKSLLTDIVIPERHGIDKHLRGERERVGAPVPLPAVRVPRGAGPAAGRRAAARGPPRRVRRRQAGQRHAHAARLRRRVTIPIISLQNN